MSQSAKPTSKVPVSSTSSYTSDPAFAQNLRTALVANSSIPTIQETLHNELQRTGWSANLRTYVTALMRSGECTNYEDLMERVLNEALNGLEGPDEVVAGKESEGQGPGLKIPDTVKDKGVKVVKTEIRKVADVDGGDEDA